MKKLAITAILAVAAMSATVAASAAEVGLRFGRQAGVATNQVGIAASGVTLGVAVPGTVASAEFAYDRAMMDSTSVALYSLSGVYPLVTFGKLAVSAKAGVSYIDPTVGETGFALNGGAGASYPLAKNVSLTADYGYRLGQSRVSNYTGNMVAVGVKYSF
jgi:opacity protein-like surface antigen